MRGNHTHDLIVIGAGSGGVAASRRAASYGAKVAICEADRVGGTCVIRGCIPKKLFVYASHFAEHFHDAEGYGWQLPQAPVFDWHRLIQHKDREIDRLNGIYTQMLAKAGVELMHGQARFKDSHTVEIAGKTLSAPTILIATGGKPSLPTIPGIEHAITSNEALHLDSLPKSIVIVGGGYIAVEFAGIFNGLGARVTQLYRGEAILRGFDDDIRTQLNAEMEKKAITLRTSINVTRIDKTEKGLKLTLTDHSTFMADAVLFATGRVPNTSGLNIEQAGVERLHGGAIKVNHHSQTSVPHIYAVGDVTNRVNLTPVAIHEGRAFADSVFGNTPRQVDYRNIPSAVFSQPSVAVVGLTEAQAREKHTVDIYKTSFRPLLHTLSGSHERCFMKLIVDAETDKVLGAHMLGADAAEIMQGIAIALQCGATKAQFDKTIGIHPSAAEEFVTMREKE